MELCLIVPTAHVEWTSLLPGRFCLANIKHDGYRELFATATREGYGVVLDNGVFENELVNNAQFIEVIREIRPQVVVVPDLMNANAHTNLKHAFNFVDELPTEELTYVPELMFVPQCQRNDAEGYKKALWEAINSGQFQWMGICRNACNNALSRFTHTADESMNKFFFGGWAERLGILDLAREKKVRFHLLGIGGNLAMLQYLWWVDRADTASLFFQATLNITPSMSGMLSEDVSRPADYFRRDFGPAAKWKNALQYNCREALKYASMAARLRHSILKDRI